MSAPHAVQIDNTVPVDDTDPPDRWQHQITVVSIEGTDVDSGVGHVEWELDGVRGTGDTGDTVSIGHGIHDLKTRIVDDVGNATRWVDAHRIKVDITGPVDTTTVPSGWVTDGNEVQVSITGDDSSGVGVNRIEWKLTNTLTNAVQSGDVAGAGPVPVTVSGDGVHKLETRLTDGVGDNSGWRTQYVAHRHRRAGRHDEPRDRVGQAGHAQRHGRRHRRALRHRARRMEAQRHVRQLHRPLARRARLRRRREHARDARHRQRRQRQRMEDAHDPPRPDASGEPDARPRRRGGGRTRTS